MSKPASRRVLGSDLKKVDSHVIKPEEYEELPELTEEMEAQAVFRKATRCHPVDKAQPLDAPDEIAAIGCDRNG